MSIYLTSPQVKYLLGNDFVLFAREIPSKHHPPKPPWLANPCALSDLEASTDRPLWVSGRDAEVFFDQLLLSSNFWHECEVLEIQMTEQLNKLFILWIQGTTQ